MKLTNVVRDLLGLPIVDWREMAGRATATNIGLVAKLKEEAARIEDVLALLERKPPNVAKAVAILKCSTLNQDSRNEKNS